MKSKTLEKWIWPLIFVGMLLGALGLSIEKADGDADFGRWFVMVGALAAAVGVVMIYLRSRIKELP